MALGENIRALRKKQNLTIVQLAQCCGVSDRIIQRYETNKATPSMNTLRKLSDALGVSMSELLDNNPEKEIKDLQGENLKEQFKNLGDRMNLMMAGGEIPEEDMDAVMTILNRTFFNVKGDNDK